MKLSIIIPVYNAEKYLNKCLDSIINQTYKDIEIILINDGSIDNSLKICKEYEEDSRIVIIDKNNNGVSEARNDGLKRATGEYVTFVDADDWLDLNTCETIMNVLNNNNYDLLLFPYIREYNNKSLPRNLFNSNVIVFSNYNDVNNKIYKNLIGPLNEIDDPVQMEILNSVWGKVYRRKIIKNIRFVDYKTTIGEDLLFNIDSIKNVGNAIYISDIYYHYNKTNQNSLTKVNINNLLHRWINMFENIEKRIDINDLEMLERLKNRKCINFITISQQLVLSKKKFIDQQKILKDFLNESLYENIFNDFDYSKFKLKWRFYFYLCKNKKTFILCLLIKIIIYLKMKGI